MLWTQDDIVAWAEKAFGPSPDLFRIFTRANEELAELLRAIASDATPDAIAEEAADTAIILARAMWETGKRVGSTRMTWRVGPGTCIHRRPRQIAIDAHRDMAKLMEKAVQSDFLEVLTHGIDIMIALTDLCAGYGKDLGTAIDAKMAINSTRHWTSDGTGHGYHIRQPEREAAHV